MNGVSVRVFVLFALAHVSCVVYAYKEATHADISERAVLGSVLNQIEKLNDIGLTHGLDDPDQTFPSSVPRLGNRTILGLVKLGAEHEDKGLRPVNHFFDPVNNRALTGIPITNHTSPDWALEDQDEHFTQDNSYKDARDYFFLALTSETDRGQNWGLTFRSLGQVIHHLQDMAQPQHVRNDMHLDRPDWDVLGLQLNLLYDPSYYELYTDRPEVIGNFGNLTPYRDIDVETFNAPRKFWNNIGRGIAEFTNNNFVSADTIFEEYDLPDADFNLIYRVDIEQLCASAVPACPNPELTGEMYFTGTYVYDLYTGQTIPNPYATTRSLFDDRLEEKGHKWVGSLNRFNFDLGAHNFLIPRAIAYSRGLINYFFRGEFELSVPNGGAYAVVDHNDSTGNAKFGGGFDKVVVKIKNVTPSGQLVEEIPAGQGELRAVVKYHLNNCYEPDLSGEYGSPDIEWRNCRSNTEQVSVSSENDNVTAEASINNEGQEAVFTFNPRIPISATDIKLQVVYRGRLGEESDAVVVATKDISEPIYIEQIANRWDQLMYPHYPQIGDGPYTFEQWCAQGEMTLEECRDKNGERHLVRMTPWPGYDSSEPGLNSWNETTERIPFAALLNMPPRVGEYARVAVLADAEPVEGFPGICLDEWGISNPSLYQWFQCRWIPTIVQRDPETDRLDPSVKYKQVRGIYLREGAYEYYSYNPGNQSIPDLIPVRSTILFPTPPPP